MCHVTVRTVTQFTEDVGEKKYSVTLHTVRILTLERVCVCVLKH